MDGKVRILTGTLFFNSKPQIRLVDKLVQVGIFQTEFVKCIIDGLSVNRRRGKKISSSNGENIDAKDIIDHKTSKFFGADLKAEMSTKVFQISSLRCFHLKCGRFAFLSRQWKSFNWNLKVYLKRFCLKR